MPRTVVTTAYVTHLSGRKEEIDVTMQRLEPLNVIEIIPYRGHDEIDSVEISLSDLRELLE